jgi:proline iminopeptidase
MLSLIMDTKYGSHEYLECLEDFFPKDCYQLIFYDQLGSYYSDQPDDPSL